jgi:hypothetical protein
MTIEELTLVAAAATLLIAIAMTLLRRRAIDRRLERSVLTLVETRHSRRSLSGYLAAIRDQPALGLKAVSASCFFASYCTTHPVTDGLLILGLTAFIGFPLGYVLWTLRR